MRRSIAPPRQFARWSRSSEKAPARPARPGIERRSRQPVRAAVHPLHTWAAPQLPQNGRAGGALRHAAAFALVALLLSGCFPSVQSPGAPPIDGPPREPTVRVGILVDSARATLGATTSLELLDGMSRDLLHTVPAGDSVRIEATGSNLVIRGSRESVIAGGLLIARATGDGLVRIGGRPFRGIATVRASGAGRVTVVNEVDMEQYLLGVVPYEIGRVGPELLEASKAQAVAARTYAYRYLGRRASLGFDVFATVDDQVYGGAEGEHQPVSEAVLATAGEILTYQGQPLEAFYHSTCAGQTAAIEEVWPQEAPRPYLVSVIDRNPSTGEAYDSTSSRFRWTQRWTADEINGILSRTLADSVRGGGAVGTLRDMQVQERTHSGRVRRMVITTSNGSFTVGGDRVRWILPTQSGAILNSSRFDIAVERDAGGAIIAVQATGGGWGHGIGMCQVGAMGRARAGQDYRTILSTYYPSSRITKLY